MVIPINYEKEFDELFESLKAKYPQQIFDLEGIGKQLDLCDFSKTFFKSTNVADNSSDANANVDDLTVVAYENELPKPWMRLNSLYLLWKYGKKLFGLEWANKAIEKEIAGEYYINDLSNVQKPYSYYGKTTIVVKVKDKLLYTTMQELYDILAQDYPSTIIDENATQINLEDVFVLDDNNEWVKVSRILKHKSHTNLVGIETKNGYCTLVTTDHPVILDEGECLASQLSRDKNLKVSTSFVPLTEQKNVDPDYAYFVGFLIGDGHMNKCDFTIHQKDAINTKIYEVVQKLFDNVKVNKDGTRLEFGHLKDVPSLHDTGFLSKDRKLPKDILTWDRKALKNLIAGLIDSEGNINSGNGVCSIRTISYELTQQLGELFRALNLGNTRVSFCGKYHSKNGYHSDNDVYRVSCRITDKEMIEYSVKVSENQDLIYKKMYQDGRWETNQIHKLFDWETPEYVYDITTESGHFHCNGLIQHNCFNFSTLDLMYKGLPFVKKINSNPAKHLSSFCGQLIHFTSYASNQVMGAVRISGFTHRIELLR